MMLMREHLAIVPLGCLGAIHVKLFAQRIDFCWQKADVFLQF